MLYTVDHPCLRCGGPIKPQRTKWNVEQVRWCSPRCASPRKDSAGRDRTAVTAHITSSRPPAAYVPRPEWRMMLPTGTVGAVHEMLVAMQLMTAGWDVYRALSPAAACDLLITADGTTLRVEVTTGTPNRFGETVHPSAKIKRIGNTIDVLASVGPNSKDVVWLPSFPVSPSASPRRMR